MEQRRNADGSMSISIGGGGGGSADNNPSGGGGGGANGSGGEEPSAMNISNVAHLLLYDEDGRGNGEEGNKDDM